MQAAAAVAKAATTTATVGSVEGLSATINIATAAPALEIGKVATTVAIPAATEMLGGITKATEVGANVVEVAPAAEKAAQSIDLALNNKAAAPEQAMKDLIVSPLEAEGVVSSEASTIGAEWADQKHTEILRAVQPQMAEWEKSHLPGNDIDGWIEQRAAAERQFMVNEGVNRDLTEWKGKEENRMPDKDKDTEGYAKWEKRLAARERESRQANEASYEQFLAEQDEKNKGMSRQEFMRRYARLQQLRASADNFAMRLQGLRASPNLTSMRKEVLARADAQLADQRGEIAILEAELQFDAIKSGSLWKQYIIPAAVGIAMVAGPMAASANEV